MTKHGVPTSHFDAIRVAADAAEEQHRVLVGRLAAGEVAMGRVEELEEELAVLRAEYVRLLNTWEARAGVVTQRGAHNQDTSRGS